MMMVVDQRVSDETQPGSEQVGGRALVAMMVAVALVMSALMYVVSRAASSLHADAGPVVGYTSIDGHDTVLVAYGRTGAGGGLPFIGMGATLQERLAAIDMDSGELFWDVQLADSSSWQRGVIAVGDGLAYVVGDFGLSVVSVADGEIMVDGSDIEGLHGDYVEAHGAYGFDPRIDAVVALTGSGGVVEIPVGELAARPADAGVAADWERTLYADTMPMGEEFSESGVDPAARPYGMALPDGGTLHVSLPYEGSPTADVVRRPVSGDDTVVGSVTTTRAALVHEIVLTPGALATDEQLAEGTDTWSDDHAALAPLGVDYGVAMVRGAPAADPGMSTLHQIDIDSGEVLSEVEADEFTRVTQAPNGDIVAIAMDSVFADRVIVFDPAGEVADVRIGRIDFFNRPVAEVER